MNLALTVRETIEKARANVLQRAIEKAKDTHTLEIGRMLSFEESCAFKAGFIAGDNHAHLRAIEDVKSMYKVAGEKIDSQKQMIERLQQEIFTLKNDLEICTKKKRDAL